MSTQSRLFKEAPQDAPEPAKNPDWMSLPTSCIYLDKHGAIVTEKSERKIQAQGVVYYCAHVHYRTRGTGRNAPREYLLERSKMPLVLQMKPVKGYPHSVSRVFRYGVEQML